MSIATPAAEVADTLARDLGIESGIRYAERIFAADGELAITYGDAADILRARGLRLRAVELGWIAPQPGDDIAAAIDAEGGAV